MGRCETAGVSLHQGLYGSNYEGKIFYCQSFLVLDVPGKFPGSVVKSVMWQALRQAEGRGRCYNGGYRAGYESCTYWKIGDYRVTYFTDDPLFISTKLTEEMMDDLIIVED